MAVIERQPLEDDPMVRAIESLAGQLRLGDAFGKRAGEGLIRPDRVVLAGMGGSAMGGELLRALTAQYAPVPMTRVRGFAVPRWVDQRALVLCVSYSGNTAETLSCATNALEQGARVLGIGSGGMLADLCSQSGSPFVRVPSGLQPRAALGYLFGALAGVLGDCGLAPDDLATQAAAGVDMVVGARMRALGERLAQAVPLIYGPGPLAAVAYRWKTQLNENAKLHAFSHAFPELAHNEIVAWERDPRAPFVAVVLRDDDEAPLLRRMIDVTVEQMAARSDVHEVRGLGETPASRAFSLVAMGDWASYHAAQAQGIDATPVASIQELKRRLAGDDPAASPTTTFPTGRSLEAERSSHLEVS